MWKLMEKSKERILGKLEKSGILRSYSVVHVAMETKTVSATLNHPLNHW